MTSPRNVQVEKSRSYGFNHKHGIKTRWNNQVQSEQQWDDKAASNLLSSSVLGLLCLLPLPWT